MKMAAFRVTARKAPIVGLGGGPWVGGLLGGGGGPSGKDDRAPAADRGEAGLGAAGRRH